MNRLTTMIGAIALLLGGGGLGYLAGQRGDLTSAQRDQAATDTQPTIAEIVEAKALKGPASTAYVHGFSQALDIVTQARDGNADTAEAMLATVLEDQAGALALLGTGSDALVEQIAVLVAPAPAVQAEFDATVQDLEVAQTIAQSAIIERDTAQIELAKLAETIKAVEDQLKIDAVDQAQNAERERLIALLALEQERTEVLRGALESADAQIAATTDGQLANLDADAANVQTTAQDIDRLTARFTQTEAKLIEARAQLELSGQDLSATIDELEAAQNSLTLVRTELDAAQAELFDTEAKRLTAQSDVDTLQASLETRRAQIRALDAVGEGDELAEAITALAASQQSPLGESSKQVNEQILSLARKVANLENRLGPLQEDFEQQVSEQASARASVIAEELAQTLAQDMAQDMAQERALTMADEMAQEIAEQLADERAVLLAELLAVERIEQMTPAEIEELAGYRVVGDDVALDTVAPIRAYLYQRLLQRSSDANGGQRQLIGNRLLLSTNTLFPVGGIELSLAGKRELRAFGTDLIETLKEADAQTGAPRFSVQINGHADKRPFLSRFGNWELSALRAVSVAEFLIQDVGLPPERLAVAGFAEYQPLFEEDTEEAYSRNRRIEFRLVAR